MPVVIAATATANRLIWAIVFKLVTDDLFLTHIRSCPVFDYIPCIAWGRNARFAGGLEVGSHLQICGRVQSREYTKKIGEEEVEKRVAYEVSVSKIDLVEDEE